MFKNKRILAIIPARSGSKGIKHKNIIDLNGKPLISYSIEAGLKSKYIDKVIVSTDGEEIAEVARKYGAEVPFLRPKDLASDTSKSIDVVIHAIEQLKMREEEYDYCVLLQPTQPLRKSEHIDESIEKIINKKAESLVSVCEVEEHPILMRRICDDKLINLLEGSSTVRRQDFEKVYIVNGAIYINQIDKLSLNTSLNDNITPYIMKREYSVDIDTIADLKVAEKFLKLENKDR